MKNNEKICGLVSKIASRVDWVPSLLGRLVVGFVFLQSGLGKFQHLDNTIEFFRSLGIPAASLQAPFVAAVEVICGGLLMVGLGTRVAALVLIPVMLVAIVTAQLTEIQGLYDLLKLSEFLYILILLLLVKTGGGWASLDHYICCRRTAQKK